MSRFRFVQTPDADYFLTMKDPGMVVCAAVEFVSSKHQPDVIQVLRLFTDRLEAEKYLSSVGRQNRKVYSVAPSDSEQDWLPGGFRVV